MTRFCCIILVLLIFVSPALSQQSWYTKAGVIRFESKAPLEDIEAVNRSVTCVFHPSSGKLQFSVLMRSFEFRKALMQEHFNENYVESDKYPRATFNGEIIEADQLDLTDAKDNMVKVKGSLTIHGVTHPIETTGNIKAGNGKLILIANFEIQISDYKISIPSLVKDKVSNKVRIFVNCSLQSLN